MSIRSILIVSIALLLFSTPAFCQGLAEYGTTASTSSAAAAKSASTIQNSVTKTADALGNTLNQSQPDKRGSQPKLIEVGKAEPSAPSVEAAMRSNRQKLEAAAGANGAVVQIVSAPTHGAIYVDGVAVAYAPADVRVAVGKHVVEVRHPAFFDWKKQISLAAGETLRLEPKLAADPRQLYISFDK